MVKQLRAANISWKSCQEDIDGTECPLTGINEYAPRHNPMVFFDDVTGRNSLTSPNCISHIRPYSELASDLAKNTVARYNFITPNLCHAMHGDNGPQCVGNVAEGDSWLSTEVPRLLASSAFNDNGALFILWDEGSDGAASALDPDGPIGMIVLSPKAKGGGVLQRDPAHSQLDAPNASKNFRRRSAPR